MNKENRNCQSCKKDFIIEPDDFLFYEKMKVPAPTFCPECRQMRRYAWRNERVLYRRNCDLCSKSIVTIYSPNKPYKVYCPTCWWSDKWSASDFSQDFDFSRSFFEQFQEVQLKVPRIALLTKNSVNSEYTNHSGDNKNAYLAFVTFNSENVLYTNWAMKSKDCVDCTYIYDKGELSYECINSQNIYKCKYGNLLKDCIGCYFCYDCHGCTNCFLSTNLRNKKYYFLNMPYNEKDYFEKVKEFNLGSYKDIKNLSAQYEKLVQKNAIHRYVVSEKSVNSIGGTLINCKNVNQCFDDEKVEDSKFCIAGTDAKDGMDTYHYGFNSELTYESHAITHAYNVLFSHLSYDNSYLHYCDSCHNSENLFGCVGLKHSAYSILNKKYDEKMYKDLKEKIIERMKRAGEYGEFFPSLLSPFGYNETQGQVYIPLAKKEALAKGYKWEDFIPGTFGKETISPDQISDDVKDINDTILKEILRCENCKKNYNIVNSELSFYHRENIPVPRLCSDCRYKNRMSQRPPRKLWHRQCMCDKKHVHHTGKCTNEFETSYAPDRPEIVYCESCYNSEVA